MLSVKIRISVECLSVEIYTMLSVKIRISLECLSVEIYIMLTVWRYLTSTLIRKVYNVLIKFFFF